jgi:hypothetical protein
LYLNVFDAEGKLRDAPDLASIHSLRQLLGSAKKLELPCQPWRVANEVKDFIAIERSIRNPTCSWSSDEFDGLECTVDFVDGANSSVDSAAWLPGFGPDSTESNPKREHLRILQQVCDRMSASLGDFGNEASQLPKHGPGVVANLKRGESKYSFPFWSRKLQAVYPHDYYAYPNLGFVGNHDRKVEWALNHEYPSRLISVPKTQKAPRLIAAEPVEHQWIQQLIMRQLEVKWQATPIGKIVRLRDQTENRSFAITASKTGAYATVDLSSASDRLSCWTVERAFRANQTALRAFHSSRTRWLRNRIEPTHGEYILLKKFAAMGSACTFPVQSFVYACIAVAAVLIQQNERVTSRSIDRCAHRVRVYGDDIIIPVEALSVLVELLTFNGLKVNTDKTFGTGKFRESCGMDAYDGYDVAPTYLKLATSKVRPSQVGGVLDSSNNYFRAGMWHVADWLRSLVDKSLNKLPVTSVKEGNPGWQSYCGSSESNLRKRFNKDLQRYEISCLVPHGTIQRRPICGTDRLYQWFIESANKEETPGGQLFVLRPPSHWEAGAIVRADAYWRRGWAPSRVV